MSDATLLFVTQFSPLTAKWPSRKMLPKSLVLSIHIPEVFIVLRYAVFLWHRLTKFSLCKAVFRVKFNLATSLDTQTLTDFEINFESILKSHYFKRTYLFNHLPPCRFPHSLSIFTRSSPH